MRQDKIYTVVLFSRIVSTIGNAIFYPVLLISITLTNHVYMLSTLATLSEHLPLLLGAFLVSFAQKFPHKTKLLFWSACLRGAIYLVISFLFLNINMLTILIAIILNFCSDTLGTLANPIETQCLINTSQGEEAEKKFGRLTSFSQIASLSAILFGAILSEVFSYSVIALINALLFFSLCLGYWRYRVAIHTALNLAKDEPTIEVGIIKQTIENIQSIVSNKGIVAITVISGMLNIVYAAVPYLNNLIFGEQIEQYNIYTFLTMFIISIGIIIGGFIASHMKKITYHVASTMLIIVAFLIFLNYYLYYSAILLILFLLLGVLGGMMQAKLLPTTLKFLSVAESGYLVSVMDTMLRIFSPIFLLCFGASLYQFGMKVTLLLSLCFVTISIFIAVIQLGKLLKKQTEIMR